MDREGGSGGGGVRESTGNRDGESQAIWKVIPSLNAVYLFINERKVFSEPGGRRKKNISVWRDGVYLNGTGRIPSPGLLLHSICFL